MTDPLDAQRRDDLARSLSISHSGPILEANDWRPLAGNVLYLIRQAEQAARKKALEEAADRVIDMFNRNANWDEWGGDMLRTVCSDCVTTIRSLSEET